MLAGRAIRLWCSHPAARTAGLESALSADFGCAQAGRKTGIASPLPVPCFAHPEAARTAGLESALSAHFGSAQGGRKTGTRSPLPVPSFAHARAAGTGGLESALRADFRRGRITSRGSVAPPGAAGRSRSL